MLGNTKWIFSRFDPSDKKKIKMSLQLFGNFCANIQPLLSATPFILPALLYENSTYYLALLIILHTLFLSLPGESALEVRTKS